MSQVCKIQLKTSSIQNVPLQKYEDFTFIVNDKIFKTSRIISDILSPKICKIHAIDPTFDTYIINTQHSGDFSHVLNLINFDKNDLQIKEIPFIIEIIENLGNDSIDFTAQGESDELTTENVLSLIKVHENSHFFIEKLNAEIDYVCLNLNSILINNEDEFLTLEKSTILRILSDPRIQVENEDQIISVVNKLYICDQSYSNLYETVLFSYVSVEKMKEFVEIFEYIDMTSGIWKSLSNRLKEKIDKKSLKNEGRYKKFKGIEFVYSKSQELNGIINYFKKQSNNNLSEFVNITSSIVNGSKYPLNAVSYDDKNRYFSSGSIVNPWICFDFKDKRVLLESYVIRKYKGPNQPKSWVIECRNDENENWKIIDEYSDCDILKGNNVSTHSFSIQNSDGEAYRYIRMRSTDIDWSGEKYLCLNSIEFFGILY